MKHGSTIFKCSLASHLMTAYHTIYWVSLKGINYWSLSLLATGPWHSSQSEKLILVIILSHEYREYWWSRTCWKFGLVLSSLWKIIKLCGLLNTESLEIEYENEYSVSFVMLSSIIACMTKMKNKLNCPINKYEVFHVLKVHLVRLCHVASEVPFYDQNSMSSSKLLSETGDAVA